MASCLRRLPCLLLLAAAACSSSKNPPLRIVIAHRADQTQCTVAGGGAQKNDDPLSGENVATVRLSVRMHHAADDVAGSFLCDRVFSAREVPTLKLPTAPDGSFDVYGEAYAAPPDGNTAPPRVAVGALLNVPFGAKTLPDLRLYRDED